MSRPPDDPSARPLWAEIDLDAIAHNFAAVRRLVGPGVRVYACLKGNAYGCGVEAVGSRLSAEGAEAFAVGNIDDALRLRATGLSQPILLSPNCLPDAYEAVVRHRLTISLSSLEEADAWASVARERVSAFIKVDVGAFRAGVSPGEAAALGRRIAGSGHFRLVGLYGHLHLPEPAGMEAHAAWQFQRFQAAAAAIDAAGIAAPERMISGSAAVLHYPEMDLNAVDPGRMLYGLGFVGTRRSIALRPALTALKTRLVLCKSLADEDLGGFAAPFAIRPGMRIGIVPVGWADGFPRPCPEGAVALVRGRRVPLLGPTHFEHLRVDLTDVTDARLGDEVVLVGDQAGERLPLDEVARSWKVTPLEILGGLRSHIVRRHVGLPGYIARAAA